MKAFTRLGCASSLEGAVPGLRLISRRFGPKQTGRRAKGETCGNPETLSVGPYESSPGPAAFLSPAGGPGCARCKTTNFLISPKEV